MTGELDKIRTELQHAREDAPRDVRKSIENINQAIQRLEEWEDDPRDDRIDSIREELSRLEEDIDGEAYANVRRAREHLREFEERRDASDGAEE